MGVTTNKDIMPTSGGIMVASLTEAKSRADLPNDLIPLAAGRVIVTEVLSNGQLGTYRKSFEKFLISFNATGTRTTEDLETGTGADEPKPISQATEIEMIVNTYNPEFHAMITGKTVTKGAMATRRVSSILIVKGGTDPDFTYTYTFPTESKAVEKTTGKGNYDIILSDARGHELQSVVAGTALQPGMFIFDPVANTISVSADYDNESLNIIYYTASTGAFRATTSETIKNPTIKVECVSALQSHNFGTIYVKSQIVSRCSLSGDVPEMPTGKEINSNMTYNLTSMTPAIGEAVYEETIDLQTA